MGRVLDLELYIFPMGTFVLLWPRRHRAPEGLAPGPDVYNVSVYHSH